MIIVKFQAGLGNQMFQYAFYRAMKAHYLNCPVKMDLTEYRVGRRDREFQLDEIFGIECSQASDLDIRQIADYYPFPLQKKCFRRPIYNLYRSFIKKKIAWFGRKFTHLLEDDPTIFNQNYFKLNSLYSYYCEGYWLNSGYFKMEENKLREIFNFKLFMVDDINDAILKKIKNTASVSVHVRRGDYQNSKYDIVSLSYYERAFALIRSKISNPVYYFFSDSPDYCKKSFDHIENKIIIDCNTNKNCHLDLYLMSQCQHNIIPNSTFSFWGAYLNANPDKLVIAPYIYLNNFKNSLALDSWICI